MRSLTRREKVLLTFCLVTLFLVVNVIGGQIVIRGIMRSRAAITELEQERKAQQLWLLDRDFYLQREEWFRQYFAGMASAGKAQGELLEEMQNQAYERKLELERQTLLEPVTTEFYQEVAVNLRLEGELTAMQQWLTTLQDPTSFQVIKSIDLELDTRSRETEPQGEVNVTVARWFNPEAGAPVEVELETAPAEPVSGAPLSENEPSSETTVPVETSTAPPALPAEPSTDS